MSTPDRNEEAPPHEWSDAALDAAPVLGHRGRRTLVWVAVAVLVVVLLLVLPPLINVGRYQHRVAQGISDSIGRPVHFDEIHLHLLPLPGLTIQNFVVQEDPAFGVEPAMRANTVEARLRLSSLWRRRIEVSRIMFEAPSINLVRRADGRWNLQGVVSQAGTVVSAPTAQRRAGAEPRFPYIEATDARINVKTGETKLPWSLVDAKLALWLPDATEWRVRLRGRPLRTDTDVSDVGEVHLEGSLGRETKGTAAGLMAQPLAVSARWESTPLGEAAKLLLGRDTGFRGAASAEMEVRGTPAAMRLSSDLHLHNLRRAEFVPRLPMSVNAHCEGEALSGVHALHAVRCAVPTAQSAGLLEGVFRSGGEHVMQAPDVLAITGDLPDAFHPETATWRAALDNGKPEYFLNWLRVFSSRIPEEAVATGSVSLEAKSTGTSSLWQGAGQCQCTLQMGSAAGRAWVIGVARNADGTRAGAESGESTSTSLRRSAFRVEAHLAPGTTGAAGPPETASISASADLAKTKEPGATPLLPNHATISSAVDASGYRASYDSAASVVAAGQFLPSLRDDLPAMPEGKLESTRVWGGPQQWSTAAPAVVSRRRHRR